MIVHSLIFENSVQLWSAILSAFFSGSFASSMEPELRDLEESNSTKGGWLSSLMKRSKESEESRDSGVHVKASPSPARTKSRDSTGAESAEGSKSDKHGSYEDIKFVLHNQFFFIIIV